MKIDYEEVIDESLTSIIPRATGDWTPVYQTTASYSISSIVDSIGGFCTVIGGVIAGKTMSNVQLAGTGSWWFAERPGY